ncbi:beta-1,4-glucuronosyltransferase WelK [Phenylobacterium koreense]|uniref:UDP-N-acetylglucosamine transferase subunit ALG13 n=1 Tax=Phenylobacterium koreense TaxID=266125 RepID=A0ABV2EN72_9CAUL
MNRMTDVAKSRDDTSPPRLRICLAASGGGHIRQLLDLEPVWSRHDYFFVSEDTALSRSIAEKHPSRFVSHFALGQARLGSPAHMLGGALRNFVESAKIMLAERPDILITTGAGAVFFSVLWARLLGAKVVMIESFARFHAPSVFGRMAAPFAHQKVVQSKELSSYWPDAAVFDPLRELETPRPEKKPFLFATVGAILPFDRLVAMVAEAQARGAIKEAVLIQVGVGGTSPSDIETVETLPFEEMQRHLREAEVVICHGGTGSLITALREGCRVVAVPRLFEYGEVYDDHQAEITGAFMERGYIEVANTADELVDALQRIRGRTPKAVTSDPVALIDHLRQLLSGWEAKLSRRKPAK